MHLPTTNACFIECLCFQVKGSNKKPAWDVPTRWNSTYLMLDLAMELKPAICRYAVLDKNYILCPSEVEWDAVEALVEWLKGFYVATLKFSGTKYPTLNIFFPEFCEVYLSIKRMGTSPFPFIVEMGKGMFIKWAKYWTSGSSLLALACVLDPRSKFASVEYYIKEMYPEGSAEMITKLHTCMATLFQEYAAKQASLVQNQASTSKRY